MLTSFHPSIVSLFTVEGVEVTIAAVSLSFSDWYISSTVTIPTACNSSHRLMKSYYDIEKCSNCNQMFGLL